MIPKELDRRRLRWLILGFVCYFFVMVYAIPRATLLPPRIFALCGVLNFAVMGAFVFSIRKIYLRMKGLTLTAGSKLMKVLRNSEWNSTAEDSNGSGWAQDSIH
jgi:hypothetical protein